ncbi:B3/4 domain-containing protein [Bhargavaea ullalensis]|uniref:DNA/RNA-binding domain of Phe-tRNA-synthetase-like protein n=1 Tax=Bhargavaea ullalensis TaxID=1265685 RepID=A0ABV2GDX2_9BACL
MYETVPDLKFGILHYNRISLEDAPGMLQGRINLFYEELKLDLLDKAVTDYPGIAEWRKVWKAFGKDPGRYRPSAEALMRRLKKGESPAPINLGADLNNFISVREAIPCGLYDSLKIAGPVELRKGTADDAYEGLNGRTNSLENLLLSADCKGPFGSPFVDSRRTAADESTTEALHVLYLRPSLRLDHAAELTEGIGKLFTSVTGGSFRSAVLHAGHPSVRLDDETEEK